MSEWQETEFGLLPFDWNVVELGKIADITKLAGFEFTQYIKYVEDGEIIALRALNVREGVLDLDNVKRITREASDALPRSKLYKNDILFTYVGANIGQFALVPHDNKYHLAPNICRFRPSDKIHAGFLFNYLRTNFFQQAISGFSVGSTQPVIPMKNIRQIPIIFPPLEEQESIANILFCLDCKIENLRRQNETLETIAQTLFKHWFVDFEFPNEDGKPYKLSGGEMVRSELGEIPTGWRVGKLGEIYKTTSGGTPSRKESEYYAETGVLWVKSKELYSTFILGTEEKITPLGFKNSSAKLLPEKTILIAMYGATVGQVSILGVEAACNQAICAVLEQAYSNYFVYLWLQHTKKEWTEMAIGSAQQNLSQVLISKIDMVIPTLNMNAKFSDVVSPIFQKMLINSRQIETLTQTRDVLLPKLMSGKLRITE